MRFNCKTVCLWYKVVFMRSLYDSWQAQSTAVVLQAAVRMHMKRSLYRKQRGAAVILQSSVRQWQQRSRFLQVSILASWHATMIPWDQPRPLAITQCGTTLLHVCFLAELGSWQIEICL